jgi:quercetin dioxygenase-like cupin family protein
MLYDLSGDAVLEHEAGPVQPLAAGTGAFIAAGQGVTIRASDSEPLEVLVFLLTARPNQRRPLLDRPATIRELFRTPEPLPGLQEGPYEFSLARLTLPAGGAAAQSFVRSGAALDFVLGGEAALTAGGETETIPAGAPLFERFGWVHLLANPGAEPLLLVQANLSQEGVPPVRPVPEE